MSATADEVRSFYDKFLVDRMVSYRLYGNKRIERAIHFFRHYVHKNSIIVDIGCGIGIATEAMARAASDGFVVGVDISKQNIWYAKKTVHLSNLQFHVVDVVSQADELNAILQKPVDLFLLCDVIEHLPDDLRHQIFATMNRLGSDDVTICLTYPSSYYQDYLRASEPGELQVIDNSISAVQIATEAEKHGFDVIDYRVIDVWRRGQYVHCALRRSARMRREPEQNAREEVTRVNRLFARLRERIVRSARKKKYVTNIFGRSSATRVGDD